MRIKWNVLLVGLWVFWATTSYGATVGNLDAPGFAFSVGADQSSRDVEGDGTTLGNWSNSRANLPDGFDLERLKIGNFDGNENLHRLYLRGSYGFERFSFFLKVGAARLSPVIYNPVFSDDQVDTTTGTVGNNFFVSDFSHGDVGGSTDSGLFYGVGAQVTLLNRPTWRLGVIGSYLQYQLDYLSLLGRVTDRTGTAGVVRETTREASFEEATTKEIELALVLSGTAGAGFSPYGGIKVSSYKTEYDGKSRLIDRDDTLSPAVETVSDSFSLETQAKERVGFFAGVHYDLSPRMGLNLEVRAGEETGLTAAYTQRF